MTTRKPTLSPRQEQIMLLMSRGKTDKAIAAELGISPHTVNNHIRRVYQRLRVNSRVQAVLSWRKL